MNHFCARTIRIRLETLRGEQHPRELMPDNFVPIRTGTGPQWRRAVGTPNRRLDRTVLATERAAQGAVLGDYNKGVDPVGWP